MLVDNFLVGVLVEVGGLELRCVSCGGSIFRSYGRSVIGGVEMVGYRCVFCNRGIALDTSNGDIVEKKQGIEVQDCLE